jgi:hypothetical protein
MINIDEARLEIAKILEMLAADNYNRFDPFYLSLKKVQEFLDQS